MQETATTPTVLESLQALWQLLTPRELEVAIAIAEGKTNREVAEMLDVSLKTYDTHRGHVLAKLGARHNVDVCHLAIKLGYCTGVRPLTLS